MAFPATAFAYLGTLEPAHAVPAPPAPHTELVLPVAACSGVVPLAPGDLVPLLATTRAEIGALTAAATTGTPLVIMVPAGGGGDDPAAGGPTSEWVSPLGRGARHSRLPCAAVVVRIEWVAREPPDSPGCFAAVAAAVASGVADRAPRGAASQLPPGLASPPGSPDRVAVARVVVGPPAGAPLPRETASSNAPRVAWRAVDAAAAVAAAAADPAVAPLAARVDARLPPAARLAALAARLALDPRARARLLTARTVAAAAAMLVTCARSLAAHGARCGRCGARWTEAPPRPPPSSPQVDALLAAGAIAVNPHGHTFGLALSGLPDDDSNAPGTLPARAGSRLYFDGPPNEDATWLPGYAWSAALCADCACFAGWRFDPVGGPGAPFVALRRSALADPAPD